MLGEIEYGGPLPAITVSKFTPRRCAGHRVVTCGVEILLHPYVHRPPRDSASGNIVGSTRLLTESGLAAIRLFQRSRVRGDAPASANLRGRIMFPSLGVRRRQETSCCSCWRPPSRARRLIGVSQAGASAMGFSNAATDANVIRTSRGPIRKPMSVPSARRRSTVMWLQPVRFITCRLVTSSGRPGMPCEVVVLMGATLRTRRDTTAR